MAFDLHSYATSHDEILLLPNHIYNEKATDGVYLKNMSYYN